LELIRNITTVTLRCRVMVGCIRNIAHNLIHSITTIVLRTRVMVGAIRSIIRNILRMRGMVGCIRNTTTTPCTSTLGLRVIRFPAVAVGSLSRWGLRVGSIVSATA
jgi:hypothetical protein